ncbi:hypothetical protein PoB_003218500 [Plakobranchus ocellatus]|uniref:Uncharacterized protein n=1 Tax=Plakobranchus ocellatus TaxID=259542 RepID=A0AAV4ABY6_9GAST|nr:hypothetical protein PoB_003218500 [Plakobranchus ocellatus]
MYRLCGVRISTLRVSHVSPMRILDIKGTLIVQKGTLIVQCGVWIPSIRVAMYHQCGVWTSTLRISHVSLMRSLDIDIKDKPCVAYAESGHRH